MTAGSPVEAFLDELVAGLSGGSARDLRLVLAEVEAHLRDDTAAGMAEGLSELDAEARSVRRLGPVDALVAAERARQRVPLPVVLRQLVAGGLLLGGIGAVAVGVSGILAGLVAWVGGSRAVVDVQPGQALDPAHCVRWLALDPSAKSCADAAVSDWIGEVVGYRLALGVLGLVALAAYALLRRYWAGRGRWSTLPRSVRDTLAVTAFAGAGLWTLGMGVDALVVSRSGYGQWLSAAVVALLAAVVFGRHLLDDVRRPTTT